MSGAEGAMGGNCNREAGKPVLSKYQQLGKSAMLDGSSMGGECTKSWHLFPWQVEKTSPSPAQLTEGQIVRQGPVRVDVQAPRYIGSLFC